MAGQDRGLGAKLEKRMPTLAKKSMNFMRDVYNLAATPDSNRPQATPTSPPQSLQPSQSLSQHFTPYQTQYVPQRPHSSSNPGHYTYPLPVPSSIQHRPTSAYLAPQPPAQSYFSQPQSNPVPLVHSPEQNFAPENPIQWSAPQPPAPAPTSLVPAASPPPLSQPPPYGLIHPSPSPSPVPGNHYEQQQPWQYPNPNHQSSVLSHQSSPSPQPPPLPERPVSVNNLTRPYQWQSPDSFSAVQQAELQSMSSTASQSIQSPSQVSEPFPSLPLEHHQLHHHQSQSSQHQHQPNHEQVYYTSPVQSTHPDSNQLPHQASLSQHHHQQDQSNQNQYQHQHRHQSTHDQVYHTSPIQSTAPISETLHHRPSLSQQQQPPQLFHYQNQSIHHQPGNDQVYHTSPIQSTLPTPSTLHHRPSLSKPFPSDASLPYPDSNYTHQAPYDQPAGISMPYPTPNPTPSISVTPVIAELPAQPDFGYDQSAPQQQQLDPRTKIRDRPYSTGGIGRKPVRTDVSIPMMAELPG